MANSIIVSQIGARHRYIIPQVLSKKGLLCSLYTDSSSESILGKIAKFISRCGVSVPQMNRLIRRCPNLPKSQIRTTDILAIKEMLYRIRKAPLELRLEQPYLGISKKCMKWGVKSADCVYGMYFENFEFLKYAKTHNVKVVVDIYERPMTYKLISEEIRNNSEYHEYIDMISNNDIKHNIRMKYIEDILSLADYYTIPSLFVAESLSQFRNFNKNKVKIIPYASSIIPCQYDYSPIKHRLLFVGSDPVIKGLLYCAKAATKLKDLYPDLDFRVAGGGPDLEKIKKDETFNSLYFIGYLNKNELEQEYKSAEAFVFPTLFEGFAGSLIEAASCGCPIITTINAGADPNEFPALFIREKNVDEIVSCVIKIFEDSQFRDELSLSTYNYAKKFTPEYYSESLVSFFKSI